MNDQVTKHDLEMMYGRIVYRVAGLIAGATVWLLIMTTIVALNLRR